MKTILTHRWWLAAALLGVVLGLLGGATRALVPDNALTVWFVESDPELQAYHQFQETFGNDEVIVVQLHEPDGIMQPESLARMQEAEDAWEAIDGVSQVHSVLSAEVPGPTGWATLVPNTVPTDPAALDTLRDAALQHPIVAGRFLSPDGTRALMVVQTAAMGDFDAQRDRIVAEVTAVADRTFAETAHPMGGVGVIYSGLNAATQRDFGLFMGLTYLVMFLLVWVLFRDWRLVAASLGVITVGILVCLGVYGLMGHRINAVTVLLPTLVTVLGIADAVHFPVAWRSAQARLGPETPRRRVALAALRAVVVPCTLTTVTTMAGFLALTSSPMGVIQELGIYAAIGVGAALVASLVLMSLVFMAGGAPRRAPTLPGVDALLNATRAGLRSHRKLLAIAAVALTLVAAQGARLVKVDTDTAGYLPDSHRVVQDHRAITEGWGAYTPLDFTVSPGPGKDRVDDAASLAALEAFIDRASDLPGVHEGLYYGDVYSLLATATNPRRAASAPLSPTELAQLQPALEEARRRDALEHLLNEDASLGRLTLTGDMMSARTLDRTLRQLDAIALETLGGEVRVTASGYPPLYVRIVDHVMASQVNGFFIALGLIFVVLLIGLRSLRLALISLLPNTFPVLVMMGVMGFAGIDLDIATATVGAIVIGVAVDDTVHFLHAWQRAEQEGMTWAGCLDHTLNKAGQAAIVTTALLVAGFPILMLANVTTVVAFGLLTTVAALAALFGDLIILPLLLRAWPPRRQGATARRAT
ncbi:MAG: hypothetical protein CMH57_09120 [Myxococcales bacterium]|nr:hypothetical protein [Myxococcales bacterium]